MNRPQDTNPSPVPAVSDLPNIRTLVHLAEPKSLPGEVITLDGSVVVRLLSPYGVLAIPFELLSDPAHTWVRAFDVGQPVLPTAAVVEACSPPWGPSGHLRQHTDQLSWIDFVFPGRQQRAAEAGRDSRRKDHAETLAIAALARPLSDFQGETQALGWMAEAVQSFPSLAAHTREVLRVRGEFLFGDLLAMHRAARRAAHDHSRAKALKVLAGETTETVAA